MTRLHDKLGRWIQFGVPTAGSDEPWQLIEAKRKRLMFCRKGRLRYLRCYRAYYDWLVGAKL